MEMDPSDNIYILMLAEILLNGINPSLEIELHETWTNSRLSHGHIAIPPLTNVSKQCNGKSIGP